MALKTERIEARLSIAERTLIERAASTSGLSVSAFLVGAAVDRADEIVGSMMTTMVPADYFDALLTALDEADPAPHLADAAGRARRSARIAGL